MNENYIEIYGINLYYSTMRQKKILKELKLGFFLVDNAPDILSLKMQMKKILFKLNILHEYCEIDVSEMMFLIDKIFDIYIDRYYCFTLEEKEIIDFKGTIFSP